MHLARANGSDEKDGKWLQEIAHGAQAGPPHCPLPRRRQKHTPGRRAHERLSHLGGGDQTRNICESRRGCDDNMLRAMISSVARVHHHLRSVQRATANGGGNFDDARSWRACMHNRTRCTSPPPTGLHTFALANLATKFRLEHAIAAITTRHTLARRASMMNSLACARGWRGRYHHHHRLSPRSMLQHHAPEQNIACRNTDI